MALCGSRCLLYVNIIVVCINLSLGHRNPCHNPSTIALPLGDVIKAAGFSRISIVVDGMLLKMVTSLRSFILMFCINHVRTDDKINGHLRIATFFNPLARLPRTLPTSKGLIEAELVAMLAQSLNFTYDIYVPTDVLQFGVDVNKTGNWSGVLGQVIRGEVDMTISFGPVDSTRFAVTDVTVGIITDNVILMIPAPSKAVDATGIVSVYSFGTWILIAGSTIVAGVFFWFALRLEPRGKQLADAGDVTMLIASSIFSQGADMGQYKSTFLRLIFTVWCLPMVVLSFAYTGTLVSFLTAPKFQFMVNSIDEAAGNAKIQLYVVRDSSAQEAFVSSPLRSFQEIAKRWTQIPKELLLGNSNTVIDLVASRASRGYIGGDVNAIFNMEKDRMKTGKCRVTLLQDKLVSRNNGLFLQKNSPWTSVINRQLLIFNQAGLGRYLEITYAKSTSPCSLNSLTKSSNAPTQLILPQLAVPFVLLLVGNFISFIAFMAERYHFDHDNRVHKLKYLI